MKSKIFIFTTLILVVFLFAITSCYNFLNSNNNTTININLDLSKIVKTSRNETTSNSTEYILKVFAYNAASYKPKDEIENLPLLTQTENKVDVNGNVKARLDVTIGLNVIFVAKLYQGEAEEPIYAGKSEVIKIKTTNNKVHLVLTRENADIAEIPEGFVLIPAGTFQMGTVRDADDYNEPVHDVTITKSFYMGKYEVTQAEYEKYCRYTGSNSPSSDYGDGDNYPAYYVSWYDALVYCNKRSIAEGLTPCYSIDGSTDPENWGTVPSSEDTTWDSVICDWNANGYRLPTEAEWEYAARAGDNTVNSLTYSGTSDVDKVVEYAWYEKNSNSATHEVGTKLPNAFGLYDMSGNVYEWCWNWYTNSYDVETEGGNDPTGASSGSYRVERGGSWGALLGNSAVSVRSKDTPNYRYPGFRVVRTATEVIDHTHTFSTEWTKDETYHWHAATCEHTTEVSEKAVHVFGNWTVTIEPTETQAGRNERTCTICGYTDSMVLQPAPAGFRFVKGTTITGTEIWTPTSEVFVSRRELTIPDLIVSDHEVTRGEYKDVIGSDPSTASAYDRNGNLLTEDAVLNNPVNYVSWYDALVYCNKLSINEKLTPCYSIEGSTDPDDWGDVSTESKDETWDAATCNFKANGYRLPTEAEWEWLARGEEIYEYAGSDNKDDVVWYADNTNETGTREVKTKAPNGYGLYDMSGNVWELCWDWFDENIRSSTAADGPTSGSNRVFRGGSWNCHYDLCDVFTRFRGYPYLRDIDLGFRVVRTATE